MAFHTKCSAFLSLAIAIAGLVGMTHTAPAMAGSGWVSAGAPQAGKQCETDAINNSGEEVGYCLPANDNGPEVAWVSLNQGTPTKLAPLAANEGCQADAVAANGVISGYCLDTHGVQFAVTWASPASTPTKLAPLPLLSGLNLAPDVATFSAGENQSGAVVGGSTGALGSEDSTVVMWPASSGNPIQVSSYGDNCDPVDITDSNGSGGQPNVAMNCPDPANPGTSYGKVAQYTCALNLLCGYNAAVLPIPTGYANCEVEAMNNALQAVGTCHTQAPANGQAQEQAAYWASPTSQPVLLQAVTGQSGTPSSEADGINNNGNVLVEFQTSAGVTNIAYWVPSSTTATSIPLLSGGLRDWPVDISDTSNRVVFNSEINVGGLVEEHGAYWTPGAAQATDAGTYNGGSSSEFNAISPNGVYGAGIAPGSLGNENAVVITAF